MKISKLMTKEVHTCRTTDTLAEAAAVMWDHDIGALPVVNAEGHVVGIITDRDMCMAAYTRGLPLTAIQVASTMTEHPTTCAESEDHDVVEHRMSQRQVHRMPVVDDGGHPVGILSLNDLARVSLQSDELTGDEVTATLAAVCSARRTIDVGAA